MPSEQRAYVGRFAPSPTGPLHGGSLVAAMASWLDARAHGGRWLLRMEDLDQAREVPGAARDIMATLGDFGFVWDGDILVQSRRHAVYAAAFSRLEASGRVFPCSCTRREISDSSLPGADGAPVYPGTCRNGLVAGRPARAWRMRVGSETVVFHDRLLGLRSQNLETDVGDFVLKRADGPWAYQLAVVVDDAAQEVTDVVRGADLVDSTARQILLQRALGLPTPRYLHVPVVTNSRGEKLGKQTGATPLDRHHPLAALRQAAAHLGLTELDAGNVRDFWQRATAAWTQRILQIP